MRYPAMLFLSAAFLLIAIGPSFAVDANVPNAAARFKRASLLYADARFKEAAEEYERIVKSGYTSGNIYYNLGNSYFKAGDLGRAILNYERAKRLMPYDSDLKSNMEYAQSLIETPVMNRARTWIKQRVGRFLDYFSIDALTASLSIIYLTIAMLMIVAIFRRDARRTITLAAITLTLFFLVNLTLLSLDIYGTEIAERGIVLVEEADIRFEPRKDAVVHFKLYEGSSLCLIKTRGDWSKIRREDGKIGWLESASYELI